MTRRVSHDYRSLPSGRLLCDVLATTQYVPARRERSRELWIVEKGFREGCAAAGPFREQDILRALRLANTAVPDGCAKVAWQSGIALLEPTALPDHPNNWTPLGSRVLPPSISRYQAKDIDEEPGEACCSPPHDVPIVDWSCSEASSGQWLTYVHDRGFESEAESSRVGELKRLWNAHPEGSLVIAPAGVRWDAFFVIDVAAPDVR